MAKRSLSDKLRRRRPVISADQFDFIIIGAGSAGCVLTDRLSAGGRYRVLVLEAGGSDAKFWIKTPIGYGRTFADARVNWKYTADPSPGLNNRSMYWPRGRVVGGSSSINALVYIRGLPSDFDAWRALGNVGWGWEDVRGVFERSERSSDARDRLAHGALDIADVSADLHPTCAVFCSAAAQLGWPRTTDFNGPSPAGVGYYRITTRAGRRCSAADAFLRPALRRANARLETNAWACKIRFDGRRAVGVEYVQGGERRYADAACEVILSGGAVNSPQLLQLSGIGPAAVLREHGIDVLEDNVAVGGHLQDHLAITYSFRATRATLNDALHSRRGKLTAGLRYMLTRRGPLALSVNHCGGFVSSRPSVSAPDLQLYFNPVTYAPGDSDRASINVDSFSGFMLSAQPSRPTSRGRIDIASADFRAPPSIRPNYLSTDGDICDALGACHVLQALQSTPAMREFIADEIPPRSSQMNDAELLADFRARAATVYHPVGTCRMGAASSLEAGEAVVDGALRVRGVERLRVIDASVFPAVTSGNTHAPTLMVAHKGADAILADHG